jgi:hypothetical protein
MTIGTDLLAKVETELSQVSGYGTQTYGDDRILQLIWNTFQVCAKKVWWPHLMQWNQYALDGVTGKPTTAQKAVVFGDIRAVFPPQASSMRGRPLSRLPNDLNPFALVGAVARYIEGLDGVTNEDAKVFRVWPLTATGSVAVHERVIPATFLPTDNVPFDDLALIYGACWQYFVDDGSNPRSEVKFQDLYNLRMKQLLDDYNNKPIELDPRISMTVDTWVELP